jgi:hypothetical protein
MTAVPAQMKSEMVLFLIRVKIKIVNPSFGRISRIR